MKFRAKVDESKISVWDAEWTDFCEDGIIDEEGYITGWYVDGFILGDVVEADSETIIFGYWVPVLRETVGLVYTEEGATIFDEEGFDGL